MTPAAFSPRSASPASRRIPPADPQSAPREHLVRLLDWHDTPVTFDSAVEGAPPALLGVQPTGLPYSLWQLLEQMRIAQNDILEFCRNPSCRAPAWPTDYWPPTPVPPSGSAWKDSVLAFREDRLALRDLVTAPATDLYARIPNGEGQTYLRELLLVADHNAFHLGQLVVVRRLLGAWG